MSDAALSPRPARTFPLVAWLVVLGLVAFVFWRNQQAGERVRQSGDELTLILQGRSLVGLRELNAPGQEPENELKKLETGPYRQRLLVAILVAEMESQGRARDYLTRLDRLRADTANAYTPTAEEDRLRDALDRLYWPGNALNEADHTALAKRGWLGRLALAQREGADPAEREAVRAEAVRSLTAVVVLMLAGLLLAAVGLFLLVLFAVLVYTGRFRWTFTPGQGSGLYAEAFAVWFASYMLLGYLGRRVEFLDTVFGGGLMMLTSALLAVCWPRLRGRDWATVREDLGLHSGRGIAREVLAGLATYAACLPLLLTAALAIYGLTNRGNSGGGPGDPFAPSNRPSHPVAGLVLGDVWTLVALYWAAALVAPFAEELVFRGMLQRHLRGRFGRVASACAVGFVFAIIHPQGIYGVPPLLALAVMFSLAREWRGSLIAPMTAHALNNAAVTTLLIAAVR